MTDRTNPWVTLSRERRYEDRYLGVDLDQLRHESGREHPHVALRFKVFGVAVLPVDPAGRVTLIGQYRYVLDRFTWELPRGSGSVSDDALATARRELSEETGDEAGSWLELLRLDASPGISSERVPGFVAWNLTRGPSHPDPQESLRIRRLPFAAAVDEALSGAITDGPSVALLLCLAERARRGDLPEDLSALLRG
ncbi:NUDIX hydrolase [uncultured Methylobacterium sp.]|uniref:NUDIX domain-containing protein n=1 Tax=uncultured Methylobacterium sp. TaxID=157278 RepID=UPI00258FA0C6|nr:NUDIX hydrolase [uncultured Methylobacterium sp.]